MDAFSGFFNWLQFHHYHFFFSTLCLLFVPEEELCLLEMLVVFLILCSFSVLWNNVAVFH